MSTSPIKIEPIAVDVLFQNNALHVILADGREISAPLEWFPRLLTANEKQRNRWKLIGRGIGIHWDDLDEDISIENLLAVS